MPEYYPVRRTSTFVGHTFLKGDLWQGTLSVDIALGNYNRTQQIEISHTFEIFYRWLLARSRHNKSLKTSGNSYSWIYDTKSNALISPFFLRVTL